MGALCAFYFAINHPNWFEILNKIGVITTQRRHFLHESRNKDFKITKAVYYFSFEQQTKSVILILNYEKLALCLLYKVSKLFYFN